MVSMDSSSRVVINIFIGCIAVTTTSVILRLLARWKQHKKLWWDDALMITAWAALMAYIAIIMRLIYLGAAQLLTAPVPLQNIYQIYKLAYPSAIIFETINITVKISILFFYCRVFTLVLIRTQAILLGVACVAWYIASLFTTIFQCVPIHKAWDRTINGHCINLEAFVVGYEVTNILLDISLIALPLSLISTLKLKTRQKLLLSMIFALGGLVCVASSLRIVYLYKPKSYEAALVHGPIWSVLSIAVAVLCGNLPILRPILQFPISPSSLRSWYKSIQRSSQSTSSEKDQQNHELKNHYDVIEGDSSEYINQQASIAKPKGRDPYPLTSFTIGSIIESEEGGNIRQK